MKNYGVVRAIWGDALSGRFDSRPPEPYTRLLRLVRQSAKRGDQTDLVLCWGSSNFKYARYVGLRRVLLMDPDPYAPQLLQGGEVSSDAMVQLVGDHEWRRWLAAVRGFEDFDAIVLVKWSCRQVRKLTQEWWERQDSYGTSFRATQKKIGSGTVPYNGCVWIGEAEFAANCLSSTETYRSGCMVPVVRELHGGSIDPEEYVRLGYEADFVDIDEAYRSPAASKVVWRAKCGAP